MDDELTNLLPLPRLKTLRAKYFMRLFVVVAILISLLVCASAALLVPTYVFLSSTATTKAERLAALESASPTVNEKELSGRLALLTESAKILAALDDAPPVSTVVSAILAEPHPGVSLSQITYTPSKMAGKKVVPGTVIVSGTATTREALRNYQRVLEESPMVSTAALPVSAYAQSANLPFTITVTLVL